MKKFLLVIVDIILAIILSFILFEALSFYHFGDVMTKVVLIRFIACVFILTGLFISIEKFIYKKTLNN